MHYTISIALRRCSENGVQSANLVADEMFTAIHGEGAGPTTSHKSSPPPLVRATALPTQHLTHRRS
jgi:hypothetical protein